MLFLYWVLVRIVGECFELVCMFEMETLIASTCVLFGFVIDILFTLHFYLIAIGMRMDGNLFINFYYRIF